MCRHVNLGAIQTALIKPALTLPPIPEDIQLSVLRDLHEDAPLTFTPESAIALPVVTQNI
jgi:hypothetical protein